MKTKNRVRIVPALLATLAALAGGADAQGALPGPGAARQNDHREARARWERKGEQEKEVLRRRFEELRHMSPEERQELLGRAARLKAIEGEVRDEIPERLRAELERLDAAQGERRWREFFHQSYRERGHRMREKLPRRFLERLEGAPPEERARLIQRFRTEQVDRHGQRMLRRFGEELELPAPLLERAGELPLERRIEVLRVLKGLRRGEHGKEGRPPHGFSPERWERLRSIPRGELLDELLDAGVEARPSSRRGPRSGPRPDPRPKSGRERPEGSGPPRRH